MNYPFENEKPYHFPGRQAIAERELCSRLRGQIFYLWTFIAQQDLWEDAFDFLDEYYDPHIPLDLFLSDALF